MFNLKQFKLVKELKNAKPQWKWLQFSGAQNTKDELLNSLIADNKFIAESVYKSTVDEDVKIIETCDSDFYAPYIIGVKSELENIFNSNPYLFEKNIKNSNLTFDKNSEL